MGTLEIFAGPRAPQKCLLGSSPNPLDFWITLSGANPLLLQYANTRIEELDAERQKQLRLVADLTANSVSASQIDSITGYLDDWESVSFDDKRKVVDILISQIDATSESVTIHWKI